MCGGAAYVTLGTASASGPERCCRGASHQGGSHGLTSHATDGGNLSHARRWRGLLSLMNEMRIYRVAKRRKVTRTGELQQESLGMTSLRAARPMQRSTRGNWLQIARCRRSLHAFVRCRSSCHARRRCGLARTGLRASQKVCEPHERTTALPRAFTAIQATSKESYT